MTTALEWALKFEEKDVKKEGLLRERSGDELLVALPSIFEDYEKFFAQAPKEEKYLEAAASAARSLHKILNRVKDFVWEKFLQSLDRNPFEGAVKFFVACLNDHANDPPAKQTQQNDLRKDLIFALGTLYDRNVRLNLAYYKRYHLRSVVDALVSVAGTGNEEDLTNVWSQQGLRVACDRCVMVILKMRIIDIEGCLDGVCKCIVRSAQINIVFGFAREQKVRLQALNTIELALERAAEEPSLARALKESCRQRLGPDSLLMRIFVPNSDEDEKNAISEVMERVGDFAKFCGFSLMMMDQVVVEAACRGAGKSPIRCWAITAGMLGLATDKNDFDSRRFSMSFKKLLLRYSEEKGASAWDRLIYRYKYLIEACRQMDDGGIEDLEVIRALLDGLCDMLPLDIPSSFQDDAKKEQFQCLKSIVEYLAPQKLNSLDVVKLILNAAVRLPISRADTKAAAARRDWLLEFAFIATPRIEAFVDDPSVLQAVMLCLHEDYAQTQKGCKYLLNQYEDNDDVDKTARLVENLAACDLPLCLEDLLSLFCRLRPGKLRVNVWKLSLKSKGPLALRSEEGVEAFAALLGPEDLCQVLESEDKQDAIFGMSWQTTIVHRLLASPVATHFEWIAKLAKSRPRDVKLFLDLPSLVESEAPAWCCTDKSNNFAIAIASMIRNHSTHELGKACFNRVLQLLGKLAHLPTDSTSDFLEKRKWHSGLLATVDAMLNLRDEKLKNWAQGWTCNLRALALSVRYDEVESERVVQNYLRVKICESEYENDFYDKLGKLFQQFLFALVPNKEFPGNGDDVKDGTLLEYPFRQEKGVAVVKCSDLSYLRPTKYVNDSLVDFLMLHVFEEACHAKPKVKDKVHVFQAVMFKGNFSPLAAGTVAELEKKPFWIVPCNWSGHWSLCIVCNFISKKGETFLLHLDSFKKGGLHKNVLGKMRSFLKKALGSDRHKLIHNLCQRKICPEVPQQERKGNNCALFVAHYFQEFLQLCFFRPLPWNDSSQIVPDYFTNRVHWFDPPREMRGRAKDLLREVHREYLCFEKETKSRKSIFAYLDVLEKYFWRDLDLKPLEPKPAQRLWLFLKALPFDANSKFSSSRLTNVSAGEALLRWHHEKIAPLWLNGQSSLENEVFEVLNDKMSLDSRAAALVQWVLPSFPIRSLEWLENNSNRHILSLEEQQRKQIAKALEENSEKNFPHLLDFVNEEKVAKQAAPSVRRLQLGPSAESELGAPIKKRRLSVSPVTNECADSNVRTSNSVKDFLNKEDENLEHLADIDIDNRTLDMVHYLRKLRLELVAKWIQLHDG